LTLLEAASSFHVSAIAFEDKGIILLFRVALGPVPRSTPAPAPVPDSAPFLPTVPCAARRAAHSASWTPLPTPRGLPCRVPCAPAPAHADSARQRSRCRVGCPDLLPTARLRSVAHAP